MFKENVTIKRALVSVSDKTGLVELAQALKQHGVEIISTGGTAKALEQAGIGITPIEKVTGNPEAFGGRMKTISFPIESALLYRRNHAGDVEDATKLGIEPIDLVVCNLYPFEQVVAAQGSEDERRDQIDIGGPTMIRAAAKNFEFVGVCINPDQYEHLIHELTSLQGTLSYETRKSWAGEVFARTAQYDALIARTFQQENLTLPQFKQTLRYGENSHQSAALYQTNETGVANAKVLQGKELSYNNFLDADACWKSTCDALEADKSKVAVTVVKHLNPCGLALSSSPRQALELAWAGDPVSAFGSIIGCSQEVDESFAEFLQDKFIEVVMAPSFSAAAREIFARKKNLRLLICPLLAKISEQTWRSISGGLLVQDEDQLISEELHNVTQVKFPEALYGLAQFGIRAAKHLKSNAIALVQQTEKGEFQLVGAGMGQPNRLESLSRLAVPRAQDKGIDLNNVVLISDAFFPFADSIDVAHSHGIRFIVQPGGSIRDQEVIEACDKYGIAMAVTGKRHFRH